jgi:hypothetical protein
LFQDAIYKKHGQQGFTDVFDHAPSTTQQILHPDIYEKGTAAVDVALAELSHPKKFRVLAEGSVGEFDHHILLNQFVDEKTADEVAPKWRGGAFRLYEARQNKQPLLNYVSMWDSDATAKRFFSLYRMILKRKWKRLEIKHETETEIAGTGDYGPFRVWRKDKLVYSLEGGLH